MTTSRLIAWAALGVAIAIVTAAMNPASAQQAVPVPVMPLDPDAKGAITMPGGNKVAMTTIPVDGGVVRRGSLQVADNGAWNNFVVNVPSQLTYNVLAEMYVGPDPNANPPTNDVDHLVATSWALNK
jgi:hypothetical protein